MFLQLLIVSIGKILLGERRLPAHVCDVNLLRCAIATTANLYLRLNHHRVIHREIGSEQPNTTVPPNDISFILVIKHKIIFTFFSSLNLFDF